MRQDAERSLCGKKEEKKEKKKKGEPYRFAIILNVNAAKLKIYPDYAQNTN